MKKEVNKNLINVFYKKNDLNKNALKNIMVSKKGLVEIRNLGPITFNMPTKGIPGYEDINLGIETTQKIPIELLMQVMAFFSHIYNKLKTEAGALIVYDITDKKYKVTIPEQTVSGASTSWDRNTCIDPKKEIPIMEIHSHPWGESSNPSPIDNTDELENFGLFAVTGNFEKLMPIRATNGGESLAVDIADVFDFTFPQEWIKNIKVSKVENKNASKIFAKESLGFPYGLGYLNEDFEVVEGTNHPRELVANQSYGIDLDDQIDMLTDRLLSLAQEDDKILIAVAKVLDEYDTNDEFNKNKSHWDWR
jgi:hypothetical protein